MVTVLSPYCHPAVTSHPVESQCNKRKGDGVTVINQHSYTPPTPSQRPHVRLPSPSRTSLRAFRYMVITELNSYFKNISKGQAGGIKNKL